VRHPFSGQIGFVAETLAALAVHKQRAQLFQRRFVSALAALVPVCFMLGAKAGGASVNLGYGYEMEAIAACTIGGVSVTGGRGKVSSAIIGVAVFELLKAALQYLGVDANAQYIAIGIVIFVAISLDIRKYVAKK